jgi:hypothetical protein
MTSTNNDQKSTMWLRFGALSAIIGSSLNLIANVFHPKDLVKYDSAEHLKTIAADRSWTADHFLFIVVSAITLWGLIAISNALLKRQGAFLATLLAPTAWVGTSLMVVFFAIDGAGMKSASMLWLNAPGSEAPAALYSALLMSKFGVYFGSVYFFWYLGLLPLLYGMAMLQDSVFPKWISALAIVDGVLGGIAGIGFYIFGYNLPAVLCFIGAQLLIAIWVFGAGTVLYRRAGMG